MKVFITICAFLAASSAFQQHYIAQDNYIPYSHQYINYFDTYYRSPVYSGYTHGLFKREADPEASFSYSNKVSHPDSRYYKTNIARNQDGRAYSYQHEQTTMPENINMRHTMGNYNYLVYSQQPINYHDAYYRSPGYSSYTHNLFKREADPEASFSYSNKVSHPDGRYYETNIAGDQDIRGYSFQRDQTMMPENVNIMANYNYLPHSQLVYSQQPMNYHKTYYYSPIYSSYAHSLFKREAEPETSFAYSTKVSQPNNMRYTMGRYMHQDQTVRPEQSFRYGSDMSYRPTYGSFKQGGIYRGYPSQDYQRFVNRNSEQAYGYDSKMSYQPESRRYSSYARNVYRYPSYKY